MVINKPVNPGREQQQNEQQNLLGVSHWRGEHEKQQQQQQHRLGDTAALHELTFGFSLRNLSESLNIYSLLFLGLKFTAA